MSPSPEVSSDDQYAISLAVGECPDGFCVILNIVIAGEKPTHIQGGARYPSREAARLDGLDLLKKLRTVIGAAKRIDLLEPLDPRVN